MSNRWVVLPLLLPLLTAVLTLPLVANIRLSARVASAGLALNLLAAVLLTLHGVEASGAHSAVQVSQMGGWAPPLGISLVLDATSGLLLCSTALVAFCGHLYAVGSLPPALQRRYFHPLFCAMIAGVNLSFLTGDLFNLFVAFELMLMASYGLVIVGGRPVQLAQAYKYVLVNLLASAFFVSGAGLVYGMFGTLNIADLFQTFMDPAFVPPPGFAAVSVMLLLVFAVKAGAFPLFSWLPDVYPSLPTPILAVFGGILTKVGVYTIARLFPPVFAATHAADVTGPLLEIAAGATMIVPVLMAVAYPRLRLVLCMMILSGVGFSLAGISVGTAASLGGAIFYSVQSMLVVAVAFLLCGRLEAVNGTDSVRGPGGLHRDHPWLTAGLFTALLALVGLPPLSGFYGKLLVMQEALSTGHLVLGVTGLLAGAVSLLAVLRAWAGVCFVFPEETDEEPVTPPTPQPCGFHRGFALALLLTAAGWLSIFPESALALAKKAGGGLENPTAYVQAVMTAEPGVIDVAPVPPPKIGESHAAPPKADSTDPAPPAHPEGSH